MQTAGTVYNTVLSWQVLTRFLR